MGMAPEDIFNKVSQLLTLEVVILTRNDVRREAIDTISLIKKATRIEERGAFTFDRLSNEFQLRLGA